MSVYGRCEGCGEFVDSDHMITDGIYGHTRSEHDCGGDERRCAVRCPVPVACGPVIPVGVDEDHEAMRADLAP